jgi:hypothetical protein
VGGAFFHYKANKDPQLVYSPKEEPFPYLKRRNIANNEVLFPSNKVCTFLVAVEADLDGL